VLIDSLRKTGDHQAALAADEEFRPIGDGLLVVVERSLEASVGRR
jgi:hypothetical protein